jgi:fucose permease
LSVAAVLGLLKDAHLTLTDYSWIASFFYVGYFAFQLPNNILLQRLPIGKYIGGVLVCWGIITMATAFGKNFGQLAVLRVYVTTKLAENCHLILIALLL